MREFSQRTRYGGVTLADMDAGLERALERVSVAANDLEQVMEDCLEELQPGTAETIRRRHAVAEARFYLQCLYLRAAVYSALFRN